MPDPIEPLSPSWFGREEFGGNDITHGICSIGMTSLATNQIVAVIGSVFFKLIFASLNLVINTAILEEFFLETIPAAIFGDSA